MPVSRFVPRPARYVLVAVALFAGATCADNSITGHAGSGVRAVLGFAPAFTRAAADIFRGLAAFQLEVDNIHLVLKYPGGAVAKDTVITVTPGNDSIAIEATITLEESEALLDAHIELRDGAQVLFSGTQQVRARRGAVPDVPPSIPISYAGPGASATNLDLAPGDTTILSTDSVALRVSATNAQGQPVSNLLIDWSVKDGAQGSVTVAGVFRPSLVRGNTYVIARLPTGVRDSARINFIPLPSQLALISGNAQTGVVGRALAQPIIVEARGSDNLPVPGAMVSFGVTAGGGSVQPASVQVDANGRASATLTLGNLIGVNTVQASIGVASPVVITATGAPTGPGALEIVANAATARAGIPLAQQPVVQLRDSLTNLITTSGLEIRAAVVGDGHVLGGTTAATTDNTGKATFTNLQVNGPIGTAQMRFTLANTAVEVLSSAVTVSAGHARGLSLDPQPSGSAMSGVALATQPVVQVRDAFGNPVAVAGVPVTAALIVAGEGRTLGGTLTVNSDAGGAARFTNLSIAGAAGTTRLVFSAADSIATVTSNEVALASGQAAALMAVTSLAHADTAGGNVPATGLPSVSVRDAANNPVPGVQVKFRRHGGAGATINSQPDTLVLLTTDASGNAALTSRRLQTLMGVDTVLVTAAGLNDTLAFVAAVTNGNATSLTFAQQPSNTQGGSPMSPPVVVLLHDQFGNIAVTGASASSTVTVALNPGGSTAVLSGTTTVAASGGVAAFPDLSVNLAGTGYTLSASTASIAAVSSSAFDVGIGTGAVLSIVSGNAQGALAGELLANPLVARVTDLGGNPVSGAVVTFVVDSGGGAFGDLVFETQRTSDAGGLVSVPWYVGQGQQLVTATLSGVSVAFRAHVASALAIVTQPTLTPSSGAPLAAQPVVRLVDEAGRPVRRAGAEIAVSLVRVPMVDAFMELSGTQFVNTDAEGIAAFTDLMLTGQTIQPVQLRFHREIDEAPDPAITQVNSSTLTVQPGAAAEIVSAEFQQHHLLHSAGVRNVGVRVSDTGGWNDIVGAPVVFQVLSGGCTLANVQTQTDASGTATVDVNITGNTASCVIEGSTPAITQEGAQVLQRIYLAPAGFVVWTGAASDGSWMTTPNWLGGLPGPSADIFIPRAAALTAFPNVSPRTTLNSMIIETDALFNISRDTLFVNDSLIADGIVNGTEATVQMLGQGLSPTVRGNVQAKLIIGRILDQFSCDGQYHPRGTLVVDSLQVDCNFYQQNNETVTVRGEARVTDIGFWHIASGTTTVGGTVRVQTSVEGIAARLAAQLHVTGGTLRADSKLVLGASSTLGQTGGVIIVRDTASFAGDADMPGGVLELRGSMIQTATGNDGDNFDSRTEHIVRFTGAPTGTDTLRLHWTTPSGAASQFRRLEVLTRGGPGLRLYGTDGQGEVAVVRASQLEIGADARFIIPEGRYTFQTTGFSPNGVNIQAGGQLVKNGTLSVNGRSALVGNPAGCITILGTVGLISDVLGLSCTSPPAQ